MAGQHLVSCRAMALDPGLGVDLESAINNAVFPGLQGALHNHTTGGHAVCLMHVQSPEFKNYQDKGLDGARVEKILDMASYHPQHEFSARVNSKDSRMVPTNMLSSLIKTETYAEHQSTDTSTFEQQYLALIADGD